METKLNMSGLNKFARESSEFDQIATKETTKSRLRGNQRYSDQFARNLINKEASLLNDDNGTINPYDATPAASKQSKLSLFKLSNAKYQTSLLEGILKNQTNKSFNESVLSYQGKVLELLDGIHSKIDKLVAQRIVEEKQTESKKYKRNTSTLAESLATGNLNDIFDQMKSTVMNTAGLSGGGPLSMALSFLPMVQTMFGDPDARKSMVKNAALWGVGKINPKVGDYLKRYQEDAAGFFQDMLDQLAVSKNNTVSKLFKPFVTKSNILSQETGFDSKALARFDNKVYESITKIMPEQLIKQTDLLEALVTGKAIDPKVYDWSKNDYIKLSESLERQSEDRATVTSEAQSITKEITDAFTSNISDNAKLMDKFKHLYEQDAEGKAIYDGDNKLKLKNKNALQEAIASIIQSGSTGINQLRNKDTSIDKFIAENKLDKKLVNGKLENLSDNEVATRKQMYEMLRSMLDTYSEFDKTALDNRFAKAKADITDTGSLNYGAWSSLQMSTLYDQLYSGAISPEEYLSKMQIRSNFRGGGPGPGGGSSGGGSASRSPKLYKNTKGKEVPFNQLTDDEKASYRIKALYGGNEVYGTAGSQTSKTNYNGLVDSLSEEEQTILGLLHGGIIDNSQSNYYTANIENPDVKAYLKSAKIKLDAASKFYNQLSKSGLTAGSILANNSNINPELLKEQGYFNSTGDIYKYINADGKLNVDELKAKYGSLYTDEKIANIQKVDVKNLADDSLSLSGSNYVDSAADFISTLFSDPTLSKKAGIAAGGIAGYGLSKVLQMMGKKPGMMTKSLPVVIATLMSTEYAQRWASNIFGPEGSIKGKSGFSNREIFISKMVTKWIPALGMGMKTMQMTQKLMGMLGPLGYLMGIPVSLTTGAIMAYMAPKITGKLQEKLFGKEGKEKGTMMSKVGDVLTQHFPWITKYLGGGSASERMQYLQTFQQSRNKFRNLFNDTKAALAKETDPEEKAKLEEKLRIYSEADKVFTDAIKSTNALKGMSNDDESMELYRIKSSVDQKMNKLEESSKKFGAEANKFYKDTYDQVSSDSNFDAGAAANAKYNTTNDAIISAHESMEQGLSDIKNAKVKAILEEAANKIYRGEKVDINALFKDMGVTRGLSQNIKTTRDSIDQRSRDLYNSKSTGIETLEDMIGRHNIEKLDNILNNKDLDNQSKQNLFNTEFNNIIEEIKNSGTETAEADAKAIMDIINRREALNNYQREYMNIISDTLRTLYPGMSDAQIMQRATQVMADSTDPSTFESFKNKFKDVHANVKGTLNSGTPFDSGYDHDDVYSDQEHINRYSDALNGKFNMSGGAAPGPKFNNGYKGRKRLKMRDIKTKFANGQKGSDIGCSVASFNNMLTSMGMSQVDPEVLVPIANKYLTNTGVTPGFFIEASMNINLDTHVYSNDNMSETTLKQFTPSNNMRGSIALLDNMDNKTKHYVTILGIGNGEVKYDDPAQDGVSTTTLGTFLSRLVSIISFNAVKVVSSLKEIYKSTKEKIRDSKIKSKISKTLDRLESTSIGKAFTALGSKFSRTTGNILQNTANNTLNNIPNATDDETRSLLSNIYLAISGLRKDMADRADKPTQVSILEDQTLPLSVTDEEKAKALNKNMEATSPEASQIKNKVKRTLENPAVQHESKQSEAVQQKILSEENARAGAKANADGSINPADAVGENDKDKKKSKVGSLKSFLLGAAGKMGYLAGGLLTALPALLTWKIGGRYLKALPGQFKGLFQKSRDSEYDPETGELIDKGHYKDVSGFARNFRNVKLGLGAGTQLLTNKMGNLVAGGGTRLAAKSGEYATKAAASGKSIATVVGRMGQRFGGTLAKGSDLVAKIINKIAGFLYKVMDKLGSTIGKIPFLKKYSDKLLAKLGATIPKLLNKFGGPLGRKLVAKASENVAKGTAKAIPGFNLVVLVGLATSAIYNALFHTDKVLEIPKETVTFGLRLVAMAAKCVWDIIPSIISIACSYVIPGSSLAVDVVVALIQMAIGWKNFLKIFGLNEEWRQGKRDQLVEQKKAEKELDQKQDKDDKAYADAEKTEEDKELKQYGAVSDKMIQGNTEVDQTNTEFYQDAINQEAGTKANPNGTIPINQSQNVLPNKAPIFNKNSSSSMERFLYGALYTNDGQLNPKFAEERRKKLMDSPEMKAQMELWKQSGEDIFHPLGDKSTRITSTFGPRNVVGASANHKGVDFSTGGKVGVPIRASKGGKVITSTKNYGKIVIEHPDGSQTKYLHLSERFPQLGDEVSPGDIIGTSGGTGKGGARSYIPHLHYEYIEPNGVNVDPFLKLGLDPKIINTSPAGNNRENLAYLERHPFLLEANKSLEKQTEIEKQKDAEKNAGNAKPKEESIQTKAAGGPSDADELRLLRAEAKNRRSLSKPNNAPSNTAILEVMGALNKAIQRQDQTLNQINGTLTAILQYLQTTINNDMLESSGIAKMN